MKSTIKYWISVMKSTMGKEIYDKIIESEISERYEYKTVFVVKKTQDNPDLYEVVIQKPVKALIEKKHLHPETLELINKLDKYE